MKIHNREIMIYYNPESSGDKKTVAYAKSMVSHVKSYAFAKSPSTHTSWQMIIQYLGMHPKQLLNKAHPYYQEHIRGRDFDKECWLKIIWNNPELIKAPIAVRGNKAILCINPTDIYKLTDQQINK